MAAVQSYCTATAQLIQLLEQKLEPDRDSRIGQIEKLLEEREQAAKQFSPPFSPEEEQLGRLALMQDAKLKALLQQEKNEIQKDLNQLNKKKLSSDKYVNPYQNTITDGMFYDKRN